MKKEEWHNIDGYGGMYQISNHGRVKSLHWNKEVILRQKTDKGGYKRVGIMRDNKQKQTPIHRLVACAFIENNNGLPQINHKDGNKTNNKTTNLEWCNASYNQIHAYRNGLKKRACGEDNSFSRLTNQARATIRSSKESTLRLAEEYNVTRRTIFYVKSGHPSHAQTVTNQ